MHIADVLSAGTNFCTTFTGVFETQISWMFKKTCFMAFHLIGLSFRNKTVNFFERSFLLLGEGRATFFKI